jgi:hypothetical protein
MATIEVFFDIIFPLIAELLESSFQRAAGTSIRLPRSGPIVEP